MNGPSAPHSTDDSADLFTLEDLDGALSVQQTADELGIAYQTVIAHIQNGSLPAMRVGGSWRVPRRHLLEYVARRDARVGGQDPAMVALVRLARTRGATWDDVGAALGVTRQAAHQRRQPTNASPTSWTAQTTMAEYASPDYPWCGNPPHIVLNSTQALCGTDDCACFMWNPSQTPGRNRAGAVEASWESPDLPGDPSA